MSAGEAWCITVERNSMLLVKGWLDQQIEIIHRRFECGVSWWAFRPFRSASLSTHSSFGVANAELLPV
jgi:hypothetical protein